jgi:tetratricopeptide (TPR) repeat protein
MKAIELDAGYARAHALLAWTHSCDAAQVSWKLPAVAEALKSAETALALDENDSRTQGIMGQVLIMVDRDQEAESHFRRAVALNPNDAEVAALLAPTLVYFGRWQEGLEWIDKAKRLNPFPGRWYHWYRGFALYSARDYEQAIGAFKEISLVHSRSHAYLAACYAQLGRIDEARAALALFEKVCDAERIKFGEKMPATCADVAREWAERYRNPEDRDHLLDGLRKAGLRE